MVTSGHATTEDNAAILALADALGDKAEVFGGSWLSVGTGDGIARSGDPVGNRKALELLGVADNLDDLAARAGEFDAAVIVAHDLWGIDSDKAAKLEAISQRIVLGSWNDETFKKATIGIATRSWAEVRGTFINCNDRVQLLNACPVCPNPGMDPAWQAIVRLSAAAGAPLPWINEIDAWKSAKARVPALDGVTYRSIGPMGQVLATEAAEAVEA